MTSLRRTSGFRKKSKTGPDFGLREVAGFPGLLCLEAETDVGMKFGVAVYFRQELKSLSGGRFAGQQERDEEEEGCAGPVNLFGTRPRNYEGYGGSKRRGDAAHDAPSPKLFSFYDDGCEVVILFGTIGKINHGFVEGGNDLGGRSLF